MQQFTWQLSGYFIFHRFVYFNESFLAKSNVGEFQILKTDFPCLYPKRLSTKNNIGISNLVLFKMLFPKFALLTFSVPCVIQE